MSVAILKAALAVIEHPGNWTQGACARDVHGFLTNAWRQDACAWCAWGAIIRASRTLNQALVVLDHVEVTAGTSLSRFNDSHSHAEVLDLFRRTIAMLEGTK